MPTATQNRRWIRSSFQDWLVATFPAIAFNFGDKRTDIDALLAEASPVVLVDWLNRTATSTLNDARTMVWPVQLSVVAKSNADPYGSAVDAVVSEIVPGLSGKRIPIKDYTDPSAPTDTGFYLLGLNITDDDVGTDDVLWVTAITAELNYLERP